MTMDLIFSLLEWCETTITSLSHLLPTSDYLLLDYSPFLMKYMPFFPFVILFCYPLIITISIALFSASAWLFWLFASFVLGSIQLVYAAYQFLMILNDIGILSTLKTFSTIRSQIRYYTIQSGLGKTNSKKKRKRGRRREWRQKLDKATSFEQFGLIEIEDAPPLPNSKENGDGTAAAAATPEKKTGKNRIRQTITTIKNKIKKSPEIKPKATPKTIHRRRKTMHIDINNNSTTQPPLTSSKQTKNNEQYNNMQKAQSCLNFAESLRQSIDNNNINANPNNNSNNNANESVLDSMISRNMSSENFLRSSSHSTALDDMTLQEEKDEENEATKTNIALEKELGMTASLLSTTTNRLREARIQASSYSSTTVPSSTKKKKKEIIDAVTSSAISSLKFLLTGVVKRNHLSVDDLLVDDARSVAECGRHKLSSDAIQLIRGYNEEVERCLDWIADSPVTGTGAGGATKPNLVDDTSNKIAASSVTKSQLDEATDVVGNLPSDFLSPSASDFETPTPQDSLQKQYDELTDRLHLVRKLKQNMGRSALMLSGGGAQAMYHLGTIKALIESNLYGNIKVISGTSGGSIIAAMCAIKTPQELYDHICVKHISTDYMKTGRMKRENIRWFPSLVEMGAFWIKNRLLVDSADFKKCCDFYYGDITFEEAFAKTGTHVCITVSASRATALSGSGGQRLLLNHISTPHVTLASAVAASCALPGLMTPKKLIVKNSATGEQEPFEVDGVEWIDGSVQADLPFRRISTLFNVSNYIVCQTNFHVVPFLNKAHHPSVETLYWKIFQMCEWDIRSRALNLGRLGLFPKIFGQDMSKVFKQKYHGNLTLVPRFTAMQTFGLKSLANPTEADMEIYLQNGQVAAWPYCGVIQEMLRLESAIDKCISHLNERITALGPESDWQLRDDDDVESISSSRDHISSSSVAGRARYLSTRRENELLKQQNEKLQLENMSLKNQVMQLHRALGIEQRHEEGGASADNGGWDMVVSNINISKEEKSGCEIEGASSTAEGIEQLPESPKSI